MTGATSRKRAYDSPARRENAARTRAAILDAARSSFAEAGWTGTTVRGIAQAAGCSVESVYAVVGSKPEILKVLIDIAVAGDDDPVPVSDRAEFRALGGGALPERLVATARMVLEQNRRLSAVYRTLDQARGTDPELADLHAAGVGRRRIQLREGGVLVLGRPLDEAELVSVEVLTNHHAYDHVIHDLGLSDGAYVDWLAAALARALGLPPAVPGTTTHERNLP